MNRRRPSPALVISIVALFVALGGTGYAALKLPKNSVGSKQIKKNAVSGKKVKDGALGLADFSATAKAGLKGAPGTPGKPGASGATHFMSHVRTATVPKDQRRTTTAPCDDDEVATGGGADWLPADAAPQDLYLVSSLPSSSTDGDPVLEGQTPRGWTATGLNFSYNGDATLIVYVVCASP
jgi:hypothetical protein